MCGALGVAQASPPLHVEGPLSGRLSRAVREEALLRIPAELTLEEGLRLFRTQGLTLQLADTDLAQAEGEFLATTAVRNPSVNAAAGPGFNYNPNEPDCSGCQRYQLQWGLSDNGALSDLMTGKRGLRTQAAKAGLVAAKHTRASAQRGLEGEFKQGYAQVVFAQARLHVLQEIAESFQGTLRLTRARTPQLADEGELARMEVQALEAEQAVEEGLRGLRQAQIHLLGLLGVRSLMPTFAVEEKLLRMEAEPAALQIDEGGLVQQAKRERADLKALHAARKQAEGELALAQRSRMPDIALEMNYSQFGMGQDVGQPMGLLFGIALELPVLSQAQGEILQAQAHLLTAQLEEAKLEAQIAADVSTALSAYQTARSLVTRMESTLLPRAHKAHTIVQLQYTRGLLPLMDFLDAERMYIFTRLEALDALLEYWTAVFQLEQALALDLL